MGLSQAGHTGVSRVAGLAMMIVHQLDCARVLLPKCRRVRATTCSASSVLASTPRMLLMVSSYRNGDHVSHGFDHHALANEVLMNAQI
jgi:hypothetical protein